MTHTKGKLEVDYPSNLKKVNGCLIDVNFGNDCNIAIADAEHLVKCWNNHDKLVEALEETLDKLRGLARITNNTATYMDEFEKIEKVLKEVKS